MSLIGRRIRDFVPSTRPMAVITRDEASIEGFDTDADNKVDVEVSRSTRDGRTTVELYARNGDRTLLWGDRQDRICWTQFTGEDGRFENILDQDRDGTPDLVARGRHSILSLRLTGEAAAREAAASSEAAVHARAFDSGNVEIGVPPSSLQMPHATLLPENARLTWHEDVELARVELSIPYASFVPALNDAQQAALVDARPINDWSGSAVSATRTAEGVHLVVEGTRGKAWLNASPVLELPSGEPVALFIPRLNVDETVLHRANLEKSLDTLAQQKRIRDVSLRGVEKHLRFPERFLPEHEILVNLQDEFDSLRRTLDAERGPLVDAAHAMPDVFARAVTRLSEPGTLTEDLRAPFVDAKALIDSGASTESILNMLDTHNVLDVALGNAEPELSGGHIFGAATERLYTIETFDLPAAQREYDTARRNLIGDQNRWRDAHKAELAALRAETRKWSAELATLSTRPPSVFTTAHEPYTI
ncbi:MAG: hypothetical protein IPK13_05255 [Deltaproteobacteria bacterium]|nr:hypothetical protein [Deltaproteobacteria bacterium]